MNLHGVENELNRMRAESLGDAGRKVELLCDMMSSQRQLIARRGKIIDKIDNLLETALKRKKRLQLNALRERLLEKYPRDIAYYKQLEDKKNQLLIHLKIQRESLGITDHSWLKKLEDL